MFHFTMIKTKFYCTSQIRVIAYLQYLRYYLFIYNITKFNILDIPKYSNNTVWIKNVLG